LKTRCQWVNDDPIYINYHDTEWGRPIKDDIKLFEMLCLEGMQAGLSWIIILKRREHYRDAFFNFDPFQIISMTPNDIDNLLTNELLIRHRIKLEAIVKNANKFVTLHNNGGSFSDFLWSFVNDSPIKNHWKFTDSLPSETAQSKAMAKALKKLGFSFVGPTICYAFMQAVGMVNDHSMDCFCYNMDFK
jgi:DNA-3-methyladenine glycosylase I